MACGIHLDDWLTIGPQPDAATYDIRDLHQALPLALMNGDGSLDLFQSLGSPSA
jgi:hypothetical protein